jgi:hypothetical protein
METEKKLAIAAALRAYFVGIGHIDETTDKQCKTWYADVESYVESDDESLSTFAYALKAELTTYTNCCCKVESDEFSDDECGENGCQEHREFTLMFDDETEAEELAQWLTWGEGANHWILSKDKAE